MNYWSIFQLILFAGAVQGLVLGGVLWKSVTERKVANRFLALILFFFAYRLITEVLRSQGIGGFDSWLYHVLLEYNWIYGALIYFYIRSILTPAAAFEKKDWLHLIPVLLEFIISNYVKTQNFFWDGTRESLSWLGEHTYVLWMHVPFQLVVFAGLILFYTYLSKKLIADYTGDHSKPVQSEDIRWVELILLAFQIFAVLVIVVGMVDYLFFDFAFTPVYKFPVYIGMAMLTYWLGLEGFARRNTPYLLSKKSVPADLPANHTAILAALKVAMEERQLFKNPKLSLGELAKEIEVQPYQLTQVLNRSLNKSFSEYVNGYRVQEAIRMINGPEMERYTLLAIGLEVGFNSKASFNRVIKNATGKSPSQLRTQA